MTSRKPFDIPHPTKKGHRLRHVCLEGPESGVYYRGRLTGKNVIELPEYWRGLVDPETITVTLTQIKTSQDLDCRWLLNGEVGLKLNLEMEQTLIVSMLSMQREQTVKNLS